MDEELMQYQQENERLEENLLTCQREIAFHAHVFDKFHLEFIGSVEFFF